MGYRADIDGLRAIAVLSVLTFHLNSAFLPGGFVGVDIFFVISGFLITSILRREMLSQTFSFGDFYLRRIRRILPPLFLVIASSVLVGVFLLVPDDLTALAKSSRYAVLFSSNYHFPSARSYFAPDAEQMPLLHTWSLAVEEQFYLIWPLALVAMLKLSRRSLLFAVAVLVTLSLALASFRALDAAGAANAYYASSGRFGELLIGAFLALASLRTPGRYATFLGGVGAALLIGSMVFLDEKSVFPGYNAVWPCVGTALLIHTGASRSTNAITRALATQPMVYVGKLSYSLYLWHWPVLAFMRYHFDSEELAPAHLIFALSLIFPLAWVSWRWVENPLRQANFSSRKVVHGYFLVPAAVLFLAGSYIRNDDGYLWRDGMHQLYSLESESLVCHNKINAQCHIGAEGSPRVLFTGDSHAAHFTTYLDHYARARSIAVTAASSDACVPFPTGRTLDNAKQRRDCEVLSDFVADQLPSHDTIVLALRWDRHLLGEPAQVEAFVHGLSMELENATSAGKRFILVGQVPSFERNVARLHFSGRSSSNQRTRDYERANIRLAEIAAQYDGVEVADFAPYASSWRFGLFDGQPAYKDDNHLNVHGQLGLLRATEGLDWLGPLRRAETTKLMGSPDAEA